MVKKIKSFVGIWLLCFASSLTHASLINDDSIAFELTLEINGSPYTTQSGTFAPGDDVICIYLSCPPGVEWDIGIDLGDGNGFSTLNIFFNAFDSALAMYIQSSVEAVFSGTISYTDIGWGSTPGEITGGFACGFSQILTPTTSPVCDIAPSAGPTFTADSAAFSFSNYSLLPEGDDGLYGGAQLVGLEISHVPEPATLVLFGLGLAGLGWSRRKRA